MPNPAPTPGKIPLPQLEISEIDGSVTIANFCIDKSVPTFINITFREPTAKDDSFIRQLSKNADENENIDLNLAILCKLCTKFGDDDTFTTGELQTDAIPYSHLRFLRLKAFNALFPDLE